MCKEIKVAKTMFKYHVEMIDLIGVAWQLHLISDDRCEELKKKHTMAIFKILDFLGVDWRNK